MVKTAKTAKTTTRVFTGKQPVAIKKCGWCCKTLALSKFETRLVKGVETVYSKCAVCRPKHAATSNSSANSAIIKQTYKKTAKGKAVEKRFKQSDTGKAANKRFKQSDAGKAANKRFNQTDAGKARAKRYSQSDAGKARDKRYQQSDAGKAANKRALEIKNIRKFADKAYSMNNAIVCAANHLVNGDVSESPTFIQRTSFRSEGEFRLHISSELGKYNAKNGTNFKMSDYGTLWQVEHKIPREAYDFSNPIDVKRCWSKPNIQILSPEQNNEKMWFFIDDLCTEVVATGCEPLSWNGECPNEEAKQAFYTVMRNGWTPTDQQRTAYAAYKADKAAKKDAKSKKRESGGGAGSSILEESEDESDDESEEDESADEPESDADQSDSDEESDADPMEVPESE